MNKKYGYLVKLVGKEDNENFSGENCYVVYGNHRMADLSEMGVFAEDEMDRIRNFVKRFGYDRKCDVMRAMKWRQNNIKEVYWYEEYQLIEVEVD